MTNSETDNILATAKTEPLTPFEQSEEDAAVFAESMASSFIMLGYIPVMENLERQSLESVMRGDIKAMAELADLQNLLNHQIFQYSFES